MKKKRILIVDDDKDLCFAISSFLTINNFDVFLAGNGFDALNIVADFINKNIHLDLLITDIHIPQLNGLELTKKILESNKNLPVLLITADPDMEKEVYSLNGELIDILIKPFCVETLLFCINKLLVKKCQSLKLEKNVNNLEAF